MKLVSVMQTAFIMAQESKCLSYRVGAVIVKDGRIISTGYNGTTAGMTNPDEYAESVGWAGSDPEDGSLRLFEEYQDLYSEWGRSNIIHAEINSILFAARCGNSIAGATMVCTLSPCMDCAKAIAQSGIKQLVYCDEYPKGSPTWSNFLRDAGVDVIKIDRAYLQHLNWNLVVGKMKRIKGNV
jgi:dCMP deaminase